MLVDGGADVNVTGPDGTTPVILAAAGGHVALLRMLVAQPKININTQVNNCICTFALLLPVYS